MTTVIPHDREVVRCPGLMLGAFTLIELLISISIVAVLVGIAVVAIGSSVKTARQAKCSGNLRQLVIATVQYSDSNKRLLPLARDRIDVRLNYLEPLKSIEQFLGVQPPSLVNRVVIASDTFHCPEDRIWFKTSGCSYDYMPTAFMSVSSDPDPQREVSSMYWRDELLPYLWKDGDAFHQGSVPGGVLAAWPDGSVRPRPPLSGV